MRFSKQEYWSGLPFPPPGDLPNPGTEHLSPMCPALAGRFFTTESPGKPLKTGCWWLNSWYNLETRKTLDKFHDLRSHTERQECYCHLKQCTKDRNSSKQVEKKCPQEKLHECFLLGLLFLVTLESSNFLSFVLRIFHAMWICALKMRCERPRYKFELILNLLSSFQVEKAMATHFSTLAWKIPWMEEPGRLQSMGSLRDRHDWATSLYFHFHALEKEMATHSSILWAAIYGAAQSRTWLKRLNSSSSMISIPAFTCLKPPHYWCLFLRQMNSSFIMIINIHLFLGEWRCMCVYMSMCIICCMFKEREMQAKMGEHADSLTCRKFSEESLWVF